MICIYFRWLNSIVSVCLLYVFFLIIFLYSILLLLCHRYLSFLSLYLFKIQFLVFGHVVWSWTIILSTWISIWMHDINLSRRSCIKTTWKWFTNTRNRSHRSCCQINKSMVKRKKKFDFTEAQTDEYSLMMAISLYLWWLWYWISLCRTGGASVSIGYVYPETKNSSIMDIKVSEIDWLQIMLALTSSTIFSMNSIALDYSFIVSKINFIFLLKYQVFHSITRCSCTLFAWRWQISSSLYWLQKFRNIMVMFKYCKSRLHRFECLSKKKITILTVKCNFCFSSIRSNMADGTTT